MVETKFKWPCGCDSYYDVDSQAAAESGIPLRTIIRNRDGEIKIEYIHPFCGKYWIKKIKKVK